MSRAEGSTAEVVAALRVAAEGTGLVVRPCPDLRGAVVAGERGEGYVFPGTTGAWRVELWRRGGREAYEIRFVPALDAAAAAAVEALVRRRRVRRRAGTPGTST